MHKGRQTKAAIVEAALGLAAQIGLEGLSIGALLDNALPLIFTTGLRAA